MFFVLGVAGVAGVAGGDGGGDDGRGGDGGCGHGDCCFVAVRCLVLTMTNIICNTMISNYNYDFQKLIASHDCVTVSG